MTSDVQLLDAWREGDREAGSALFERYFSRVYRFFQNKVDDGPEDLVQETFLACVNGRDRLKDDGKFRGYLFGIARKVLYRQLERKIVQSGKLDVGVSSVHDLAPSPSRVIAQREEQALLVRALRRIPVDLQVTLELYYFEDLEGPELADALDIPEGTVRSRIRRGVEQLKKVVEEIAESPEIMRSTLSDLEDWTRGIRDLIGAKSAANHDRS